MSPYTDIRQVHLYENFCSHTNNYEGCYQCNNTASIQLVVADYTTSNFGIDCYKSYVVNTLYSNVTPTPINTVEKNISYLNGNCQSPVILIYGSYRANTVATIDSGAGISCLGNHLFQQLFPESILKLSPAKYTLKGAGGNILTALGEMNLECIIAKMKHTITFVIIKDSKCLLIGWPDIQKYRMIINSSKSIVHVGTLHCDRPLSTYPRKSTYIRLEVISFPDVYYHGKPIKIVVRPYFNENNTILLNRLLDIYSCNCMSTGNHVLCTHCMDCGPITKHVVSNPDMFQLLVEVPQNHYLSPEICLQGTLSTHLDNKEDSACASIQHVTCEEILEQECEDLIVSPSSWLLEDGKLFLESPVLKINGLQENNYASSLKQQDLNSALKCSHCSFKYSHDDYCNVFDEECITRANFRKEIFGDENDTIQCKISHIRSDNYMSQNIDLVIIIDHSRGLHEKSIFHQHFGSLFRDIFEDFSEKKESCFYYYILAEGRKIHVCMYKTRNYLLLSDILKKIAKETLNSRSAKLCFVNFTEWQISLFRLERIFKDNKVSISILDNDKNVHMVGKDKIVDASTAEDIDINEVINNLETSTKIKTKLKILFEDMDKEEEGKTTLFSKSTNDISYFHMDKAPYSAYLFDIKVKPEFKGQVPEPEKQRFMAPGLRPEAAKMIEELRKANIIFSGYTPYMANSVWVFRRKNWTISQWTEAGNTLESFVPNTTHPTKGALRLTHSYVRINPMLEPVQFSQESPLQQLKNINYKAKVISVIDITNSFMSLCINKRSSLLTGFFTGLPGTNTTMMYRRVPQGLTVSKGLQDVSLAHSLQDVNNTQLYSDNIFIYSLDDESHFQSVKIVFNRLRNFGFKIKKSKITLFNKEKVSLYGFTVMLKEDKIIPNQDKLLALRSTSKPNTITELRSWLGSLNFFLCFLPIADNSLSILNRMTRKNKFIWTEENTRAFENILELLKHENLIFIQRPNFNKAIFAVCDSSVSRASFLIYQKDEQGQPRVLQYGYRTFSERNAFYPSTLNELFGLLSAVKVLECEYSYSLQTTTLFTDSLPLVLCALGSKTNAKLQRIKIYLQNLTWLTISFKKNTTDVIRIADYFSRTSQDNEKKFTQKLPKETEVSKAEYVSKKIYNDQEMNVKNIFYIIDYLLNMEDDILETVEDNSTIFQNGKIVWDKKDEIVKDKNSINICQVTTRSMASRLEKLDIRLQEPDESFIHLNQFLNPISDSKIRMKPYQANEKNPSPFQLFLQNLFENAPYLDLDLFQRTQQKDPKFSEIIQQCKAKGEVIIGNKTYFLFEDILYCHHELGRLKIYKLCTPIACLYDMCVYTHRDLNHLKAKRLQNYIQQIFECHNLEQLCNHVVENCLLCSEVTKKPSGKSRTDLPKNPTLLRKPREAISIDELFISGGRYKIKMLVSICLFSHYIYADFIHGELTSESFMEFLIQVQRFYGTGLKYVITDNDVKIDNKTISSICQDLGLIKLTCLQYSPRSNLSELGNRILLDALRTKIIQSHSPPGLFKNIIHSVIMNLNTTNFYNHEFLSPHSLFFGELPPNVYNLCNIDSSHYKSKEEHFQVTLFMNNVFRNIRSAHLKRRRRKMMDLEVYSSKNNHNNKIKPGSLVTMVNQHQLRGGSEKLLSLNHGKFLVVSRSKSACLLQPLSETSILDYIDSRNGSEKSKKLAYKADISQLKLIRANVFSNSKNGYYPDWIQKHHRSPRPLYYQQNNMSTLDTWDRYLNDNVKDIFFTIQERILSQPPYLKPDKKIHGILCTYRFVSLRQCAKLAKMIYRTNTLPGKNVTFNSIVHIVTFPSHQDIFWGCSEFRQTDINENS